MNDSKSQRRSIRLKSYDYNRAGAYFVTVCAYKRRCLFGAVSQDRMRLNALGRVVAECWCWLATQYEYVEVDEWVVMPNHLHGIIVIDEGEGASRGAPTKRKPLGELVGAFKALVTRRIIPMSGRSRVPIWQRNYYEHVIRNESEVDRIRRYIVENPFNWELDADNPSVPRGRPEEPWRESDRSHPEWAT